jgi:hypothetical protein
MQRWLRIALIGLIMVTQTQAATACFTMAPFKIEDVQFADVVVIGRISNYQIIRDVEFRERMLANPNLRADLRRIYEEPNGKLMSDYARFDIQSSQILKGTAPRTMTVTWDNSTFGEPDQMAPGPYVIALRNPQSQLPPLRGPSATISPSKEPERLTVLQAPCGPAFIIPADDANVRTILKSLKAGQ